MYIYTYLYMKKQIKYFYFPRIYVEEIFISWDIFDFWCDSRVTCSTYIANVIERSYIFNGDASDAYCYIETIYSGLQCVPISAFDTIFRFASIWFTARDFAHCRCINVLFRHMFARKVVRRRNKSTTSVSRNILMIAPSRCPVFNRFANTNK